MVSDGNPEDEANSGNDFLLELAQHDIGNFQHIVIGNLELAIRKLERIIEKCSDTLEGNESLRSDVEGLKRNLFYANVTARDVTIFVENLKVINAIISGEAVEVRPIKPMEVARGCAEALTTYSLTKELSIDIEDSDVAVYAGPLLFNVFFNLFSNAVKYGGQKVEIHVYVREDGEGMAEVCVEDNGMGIVDEFKERIFQRHERLFRDRNIHGQGLGLALCRAVIEAYGGRIWVEDRVKGDSTQGARFVFSLRKAE